MVDKRVEHDFKLMSVVAVVALIAMIFLISPASLGDTSITGDVIGKDNARTTRSCTDSDAGLDYSQKGHLTGDISRHFYSEDRCFMHYFLREVYCNGNRAASHITYCRHGCENGICKERKLQHKCGDGTIVGWESCDGTNLGNKTCNSLGFIGGTLSCTKHCILNTTSCTKPVCGNNIKEAYEICDSNNLSGRTCRNFGFFGGGTLTCSNCQYNLTGCIKKCSSDSECGMRVCAEGKIHEKCEDGRCVFKSNCGAITTQSATCSDSDNGKNYATLGKCSRVDKSQTTGTTGGVTIDSCVDAKTLKECYCENTEIKTINYSCPSGCQNGACVKSPPYCGDGIINAGEECDGAQLNGLTCANFNLAYGSPTCVNCKLDATGCSASPIGATLSLNPNKANVVSGDIVTFDILVSGVANLYGYQFDIDYNSGVLEFVSLTDGAFLGTSPFCVDYSSASGLIKSIACTRLGTTGVSGSGVLKRITFRALAAGMSGVTLSNVKLVDVASATIATQATSGQAIVNSSTVASPIGAAASLNPVNVNVVSGDIVTFDILVSGVANLYGYQFDIGYDPAVLSFVGLEDGTFLKGTSSSTPFCMDPVVSSGLLSAISCTRLGAIGGVSGSGVLKRITFRALAAGMSGVTLSNVKLVDVASATIATQVTSGQAIVSSSVVNLCGNSVVDPGTGEECDGVVSIPCQDRQLGTGFITCKNCKFDISGCLVWQIGTTVSLNPSNVNVVSGDIVTFDILVSGVANLYGYQFDIDYNSGVLEFVSLTDGAFLGTSPFCVDYSSASGLIKSIACTRLGTTGVSGSGVLKRITFRALATGTSSITLSNVKLVDVASATIATQVTSGQAIVSSSVVNLCGNSVVDPGTGEECDGVVSIPCQDRQLGTGFITCKNCKFDISGCLVWQIGTTVSLNPSNVNVVSGDIVTFDILVSGVANLYGYQFDIDYNSGVLEFVSLTDGAFLGTSPFCVDYSSASGLIKSIACTRLGTTGVSGSGVLKRITFRALATGTSSITLSNVKLVDVASATITTQATPGQVISVSSVSSNVCNDNIIQQEEDCDGALLNGKKCSDFSGWGDGTLKCNTNCKFDFSSCTIDFCGNGIVDNYYAGEECDGTNFSLKTCTSLGYYGGALNCTPGCLLDTTRCTWPAKECGDGIVSKPNDAGFNEQCDRVVVGVSCPPAYAGGSVICSHCTYDYSNCTTVKAPYCGDGAANTDNEQCDGVDLRGKNCTGLNYGSGTLSCFAAGTANQCMFDESHCTTIAPPKCGDNIINQASEYCDGTKLNGKTCIDFGLAGGTLSCTASCAFDTRGCSVCNNNGVCQPRMSETAVNCAGDCVKSPAGVALYLNPGLIDIAVGDTVALDIKVSSITNLFGYQFDIGYNPAVLSFVSLEDGTFLKGTSSSTPFCMDPVTSSGLLDNIACTRLGAIGGVSGSGVLKKITFKALAKGTSSITLSNAKLVDSATQGAISAQVMSGQIGVN